MGKNARRPTSFRSWLKEKLSAAVRPSPLNILVTTPTTTVSNLLLLLLLLLLLRRLNDFNTPEELELLESAAGEVIELKDYAEWFNSLGAEVDKDRILWPNYYCEWFSTLGIGAKVDGVLDPSQYTEWFVSKFAKPPEIPDWPVKNFAELALAYLKKKTNECEDYEYVRHVAIVPCPESFHLNFYARRRVSVSTLEPAPEKLFFAEVDTENNVMECSVLEAEKFDLNGGADVLHPPNIDCVFCNGIIYYHCCPE